ncbi:2OG-Fe(II) oxygenase [Phenylobacterium sp.]|jgi:predicted 2-oxoglutarate/Fe(II)-dependent dioxygenase YbiX|uniref:2OG-Fe(II) oxygenase n=1 Tax=Phenylobacterium sp. TaxID=1871053 RepID=UPI0035B1C359
MSLSPGQTAPWFVCPTPTNPTYSFSSVAGRFVLLAFLPEDPLARAAALARMAAADALFDQTNLLAFCVVRDAPTIAAVRDKPGVRWFLDRDGSVSRGYHALDGEGRENPHWLILDPTLRVFASGTMADTDRVFAILAKLPKPDDHAGVPIMAPVLVVPRIFEPEMCRRLIDFYEESGGEPSGVMRQVGDKTVPVIDGFKSRKDATIEDEAFRMDLRRRLETRLIRQIHRAFQFNATRIERYIVARYTAEEGGYFRAHRDNTTTGTAHRKFACSINLNAEEFEGGDLRFPEFGTRTYRPPTGGAVVFSCSLLHEATPVTRGKRYAFLPFFFDEAGEQIRQKNLHTLALPETAASGADA